MRLHGDNSLSLTPSKGHLQLPFRVLCWRRKEEKCMFLEKAAEERKMDIDAFCVRYNVLAALRPGVSGVRALLRFSRCYKSVLLTQLLQCPRISKADCTAPQDSWPRCFAVMQCAIPAAFDTLTPVCSFFIFPRITLFQS